MRGSLARGMPTLGPQTQRTDAPRTRTDRGPGTDQAPSPKSQGLVMVQRHDVRRVVLDARRGLEQRVARAGRALQRSRRDRPGLRQDAGILDGGAVEDRVTFAAKALDDVHRFGVEVAIA